MRQQLQSLHDYLREPVKLNETSSQDYLIEHISGRVTNEEQSITKREAENYLTFFDEEGQSIFKQSLTETTGRQFLSTLGDEWVVAGTGMTCKN